MAPVTIVAGKDRFDRYRPVGRHPQDIVATGIGDEGVDAVEGESERVGVGFDFVGIVLLLEGDEVCYHVRCRWAGPGEGFRIGRHRARFERRRLHPGP